MVALGKAAAARTGTGAVADDEAPRTACCLGDDPFQVGEHDVGGPADDNPSAGDSSPRRPSCGSSHITRMREDGGGSCAPPGSTHQDQHQYHHQHRQVPQRSAQRGQAREVSTSPRPELEREGTGSDAEADGSGDSPLLLPSPVRTSESEGFAYDRLVSTGSRGVCGAASAGAGAGDGDGDGDGDSDGDDVGARVVSLAGSGRRGETLGESAIARPCEYQPLAEAAEAEPKGPHPPHPHPHPHVPPHAPPRRSLFDLADQSIDEI